MKTRKEIEALIAQNKADMKAFLDGIGEKAMTPEEEAKADAFVAKNTELLGEIANCDASDARKKALREMGGVVPPSGTPASEPAQVKQGGRINYGKAFVEAEQFKAWLKQVAPSGMLPSMMLPQSPAVEFKSLLTIGSNVSAGAFARTDYTGLYEPLGRAPLSILNLVTRGQTSQKLVQFVREIVKVTQAANVLEANVSSYGGGTGEISGLKPEGTMAWETVNAVVNIVAAYIKATRSALADSGELESLINAGLSDDLNENLEYQIVAGDGVGANFTGILKTPNVLGQSWDTDFLTTARKAKTYLRVTGRTTPTAWLMNPEDNEMVDLLKDGQNRYYSRGPFQEGIGTLWGVPIVECEHVTQGTAILGNFRKAMLWDRQANTISVTDSDGDDFRRNIITILAEMRAAFGVIRPTAFCLVETEAGT